MIRRSITAIRTDNLRRFYCTHCAKILEPLPGKPAAIVQNSYFWIKDGAGRIKCYTCNNVVRRA